MLAAAEQKQEQKKVPGPRREKNDSGCVAESYDGPGNGHPTGDGVIPARRKVFCARAKPNDETRTVLRHETPPFRPKLEEGVLVIANNDPGA